jgi:hypothetical protein
VALFLAESGAANVTSSARVLAGSGWRVAVVPDAARLAAAWQELYRTGTATVAAPIAGAPAALAPTEGAAPVGVPAAASTATPEGDASTGEVTRG